MASGSDHKGFQIGGEAGDLFKNTARYYAKYRRLCPEVVVAYLVKQLALDGRGRLLDVGCGTGQVFKPLAKYFEEIVAIDADEEMISAAQKTAASLPQQIRLICARTEEIEADLGSFRLATFGASFHWMDRMRVSEIVYQLLEPGGSIAILCPPEFRSGTTPWEIEIQNVLKEWLGPDRRAGGGVYQQRELHQEVLTRSRFKEIRVHDIAVCESWSLDQIVGYLYSTSYASRAVLGEKRIGFEDALRQRLRSLSPEGQYEKVAQHTVISAQRPALIS